MKNNSSMNNNTKNYAPLIRRKRSKVTNVLSK